MVLTRAILPAILMLTLAVALSLPAAANPITGPAFRD